MSMLYNPLCGPIIALIMWTFVMQLWMFSVRIPYILKNGKNFDKTKTEKEIKEHWPAYIRFPSDNYAHLHEQPTLFYAVALLLIVMNADTSINVLSAWMYVLLRITHSILQSTANIINIRFLLFASSSVCIFIMLLSATTEYLFSSAAPITIVGK
eukprot:UN03640